MAVKIRLKRLGKIRAPYYRVVVADARTKRDGKTIEEIGKYHPKEDPSLIEVDSDRVQYWLGEGAQPSEPVLAILKKTGDWQKFKGGTAPKSLLQPATKLDRRARYDEALRHAHAEPQTEAAPAPAAKRSRKPKAAPADEPKAPAEEPKAPAEEPKADAAEAAADRAKSADQASAEAAPPADAPADEAAADQAAGSETSGEQTTEG